MKCPIMILAYTYVPGPTVENIGDCLKEKCAWWNKFTEECALYMLALDINALRATMQNIKDRMPPARE